MQVETPKQTETTRALVQGLNEDLANEYQAVLMYTTYAAMVRGIHRPVLKAFFEAEIPEELEHAQFLANKITALGGTPTTTPAPFTLAKNNREMLKQAHQAEKDTIVRYVKRRNEAEAAGAHGLVADLDDLIRDETRHKEETEKLLYDLDA